MRIKESYGWHFPELVKIVSDNETYIKLVRLIGNRETLKNLDPLEMTEITSDDMVTSAIYERARTSMGNELTSIDEKYLMDFIDYVINHF